MKVILLSEIFRRVFRVSACFLTIFFATIDMVNLKFLQPHRHSYSQKLPIFTQLSKTMFFVTKICKYDFNGMFPSTKHQKSAKLAPHLMVKSRYAKLALEKEGWCLRNLEEKQNIWQLEDCSLWSALSDLTDGWLRKAHPQRKYLSNICTNLSQIDLLHIAQLFRIFWQYWQFLQKIIGQKLRILKSQILRQEMSAVFHLVYSFKYNRVL